MQLQKDMPDHHDADLIIKLYELRREAVMRESRSAINSQFWPASAEEVLAVLKNDHHLDLYAQASKQADQEYVSKRRVLVEASAAQRSATKEFYRTLRGGLGQ